MNNDTELEEEARKFGLIAEMVGQLNDEIERLKLAIKAAFEEGFDWGYELGWHSDDPCQTEPWEQSQAKKDAEATQ